MNTEHSFESLSLGGMAMGAVITSIGLKGMTGYLVNVEVELLHGTDQIVIVGLPDVSLKNRENALFQH